MVAVQKPSSPFFAGYRWLSKNAKTTFWASGALMRKVMRRSSWIRGYSAPSNVAGGGNAVGGFRILGRTGGGQEEGHQAADHRLFIDGAPVVA